MSRRIAQAGLALVLLLFALWLRGRDDSSTPEAAVQAWFEAVARGDDRACLALASGELRASLESTRAQQGVAAFRTGLRASVGGLKGVAVSRSDGGMDGRAEVDVDLVFDAKNERQRATLEPAGRGWRIVSFGAASGVVPPVRYGTPAFE